MFLYLLNDRELNRETKNVSRFACNLRLMETSFKPHKGVRDITMTSQFKIIFLNLHFVMEENGFAQMKASTHLTNMEKLTSLEGELTS